MLQNGSASIDCESYESALASLAGVYGAFDQQFGNPKHPVTGISWFLLTRTLDGTRFSEGILPLGAALPKLWDILVSIPKDGNKRRRLEELRVSSVPNYQYQLKVSDKLHHGPHAMLVRESAFNASEMRNHDYLKLPEIIEDVCWGYQERFKESIQDEIMEALRPCIVKFEDRSGTRTDVIGPVLRSLLSFQKVTTIQARGDRV